MQYEQMMKEENQNKINDMRRQRQMEKAKIQEAIFLSKKEEAKQLKMVQMQNKQKQNYYFNQIGKQNEHKN